MNHNGRRSLAFVSIDVHIGRWWDGGYFKGVIRGLGDVFINLYHGMEQGATNRSPSRGIIDIFVLFFRCCRRGAWVHMLPLDQNLLLLLLLLLLILLLLWEFGISLFGITIVVILIFFHFQDLVFVGFGFSFFAIPVFVVIIIVVIIVVIFVFPDGQTFGQIRSELFQQRRRI